MLGFPPLPLPSGWTAVERPPEENAERGPERPRLLAEASEPQTWGLETGEGGLEMDGEVGKKAVKDLKDLLGPRLRSCWDLDRKSVV